MELKYIELSKLKANPVNPRTAGSVQTDIQELANSIKAEGIIEPLIVVRDGEETYRVIAGHRRAEGAALAGLESVPCVVRGLKGDELITALVENTQRVDLKPIEIATAIGEALKKYKAKELGEYLGKSQTYISKFKMIAKAYKKLGDSGAAAYFEDFESYEELYNEARSVLGLDKKEEEPELPLPQKEEKEKPEDEVKEDSQVLENLIRTHAQFVKVTAECSAVISGNGSAVIQLKFKNAAAAEKFFSSYGAD